MVKQVRSQFPFLFFGVVLAVFACSTTSALAAPAASSALHRLWQRHFSGFMTDVTIARDGRAALIATAPNHEVDGGAKKYEVTRLDSFGKVVWSFQPQAPVKAQALSDDASLTVISTYDDHLTAYDSHGKMLWTANGTCKPFILSAMKKVVCYHDDDAEAEIAFDVYGWQGEKLLSYPITHDVLQFKAGDQGRFFALGLTQGHVAVFGAELRPLWKKEMGGEVLDLAVSPGDSPQFAVLTLAPQRKRKLTIFDLQGKVLSEAFPLAPASQVEFSPDGKEALVHGNSTQGQRLAIYTDLGSKIAEKGLCTETWNPDATLPLLVVPGGALISTGGRSVRSINFSGQERWKQRISRADNVYVYAQSYALGTGTLLSGTDDGWLTAFKLK